MRIQTIYVIWLREVKRFLRSRSRIIGSLGMPFLFLAILGTGLGSAIKTNNIAGNYLDFITPGILGMVLLMSSSFAGISVIWDKQFGFLKEMLVAPISRTSIMIGKTLGGVTTSMIQALLMLTISLFLGVKIISFGGFLLSLVFMVLIALSFVALGIAFASVMEDMQGFHLIMNFLIMPMFFLSGALFPLEGLPAGLKYLSYVDPLTYGIEGLRYSLINISQMPLWLIFAVLCGFCISTITVGTYLLKRSEI